MATTDLEKATERIQARFESFLNLNYPCQCDDPDCPGNSMEATMLVEIISEELNKSQNG